MTFQAKPKADLKCDLLQFTDITTLPLNYDFTVNTTPVNTSAVIDSNGYIQLHNNSNWRLEANCLSGFNAGDNYEIICHWYDGSSNLGNRGRISTYLRTELSRGSCSVLLRSSDISGTITIRPRVTSLAGTIQHDVDNVHATPSVRIYEIEN